MNIMEETLEKALEQYFYRPVITDSIGQEHVEKTPKRIVETLREMFIGLTQTPQSALDTVFTNGSYDEIVYCNNVGFASTCAHHALTFFGKMHFGYLPDKGIVGLSKIPRLMFVFAKRPQLQEKLTIDIVDSFMDIVKPKGCGLVIEAYHLCLLVRGVQALPAYTKTTALRGCFRDGSTKQEFLQGITQVTTQIWP
jgi:GTP cyclohydrolase I